MRKVLAGAVPAGLCLLLALSAVWIGKQGIASARARNTYEQLSDVAWDSSGGKQGKERHGPVDFKTLAGINPEIVGWIRIPDTQVDYPLVQGTDNQFYLSHDFYGREQAAGCIFLDWECESDFSSRNTVIYGHNMRDGSMFRQLVQYTDETFFQSHPVIVIYTPQREIRLEVAAAWQGEQDPVVRTTRFPSQEEFQRFVQDMLRPCGFARRPQEPVKALYTLITCSYESPDARTYVFAVEQDEKRRPS